MFNFLKKGAVVEKPERLAIDELALFEKIWQCDAAHNIIAKIQRRVEELSTELKEIKELLTVPQPIKEEFLKLDGKRKEIEENLSETYQRLQLINKIFRAGYELFIPNRAWYRGFVYKSDAKAADDWLPSEFPAMNNGLFKGFERYFKDCFVFKGVIPPYVQKAYLKAIEIFDPQHIQVYSPRKEDFEVVSTRPDPVIVGSAQVDDQHWLFFKIAVWGTVEDLKSMPS